MKTKVLTKINVILSVLLGMLGLNSCESHSVLMYGVPVDTTIVAMYGVYMYGVPPIEYAPEQEPTQVPQEAPADAVDAPQVGTETQSMESTK